MNCREDLHLCGLEVRAEFLDRCRRAPEVGGRYVECAAGHDSGKLLDERLLIIRKESDCGLQVGWHTARYNFNRLTHFLEGIQNEGIPFPYPRPFLLQPGKERGDSF